MTTTVKDHVTDPVSPERLAAMRARMTRWRERLAALGLDGLLGAAAPLAPLGAQLLWVAQPTLCLLMDGRDIDALARILYEANDADTPHEDR